MTKPVIVIRPPHNPQWRGHNDRVAWSFKLDSGVLRTRIIFDRGILDDYDFEDVPLSALVNGF